MFSGYVERIKDYRKFDWYDFLCLFFSKIKFWFRFFCFVCFFKNHIENEIFKTKKTNFLKWKIFFHKKKQPTIIIDGLSIWMMMILPWIFWIIIHIDIMHANTLPFFAYQSTKFVCVFSIPKNKTKQTKNTNANYLYTNIFIS